MTEHDWRDDADPDDLFDTPEEAALAGWSETPAVWVQVVESRVQGERTVIVRLKTDAPSPYNDEYCQCVRASNGKWWVSESWG